MARQRRGGGKTIELFPFLAILACVIGVLTLLIAGLSLGALEIDTSGTDYVLLRNATVANLDEIERLEGEVEGRRLRSSQVRHARQELLRRESTGKRVQELQETRDALGKQVAEATRERDELQRDVRELQDRLTQLESELRGRRANDEDKRPIQLRGPKARAGQRELKPRFIECRENRVVLDPDRSRRVRKVVRITSLQGNSTFRALQRDVEGSSGGIVILLVREGAVETYDFVSSLLELAGVRYGKLPVPSAGAIDFSTLRDSG